MSVPIELAMEEAPRPGRYISEHASFSLVNELGASLSVLLPLFVDTERAARRLRHRPVH